MLSNTAKKINQSELSTVAHTRPTARKILYVGADDFKDLRQRGKDIAYVDKTLLIKDFLSDSNDSKSHTEKNISKVDLILRPRRFGKTMNMTMLHEFLSNRRGIAVDEPNLFEDLNISQDISFCQTHQHKYPVIFFTLKDIKVNNYQSFLNEILKLVASMVAEFIDIIHGLLKKNERVVGQDRLTHEELKRLSDIKKQVLLDEKDEETKADKIRDSLFLFSKFLYFHYKQKVIILIDEYDSPVNNAYQAYIKNQRMLKEAKTESDKPSEIIHKDFPIRVNDFIRHWLGKALKGNPFLDKGLMTGIYPMTKRDSASDLNNVSTFTLLDSKYAEYFGFTEAELEIVLEETGADLPLSELSHWYNGYQAITMLGEKIALYNPWSLLNCLKNKKFEAYWEETGSHEFIENFIRHNTGFRHFVQQLIEEKNIQVRLSKTISYESMFAYAGQSVTSDHDVWSALFYLGYITLDPKHLEGYSIIPALDRYSVSYPNYEIFKLYDDLLRRCVLQEVIVSRERELFEAFSSEDPELLAKILYRMFMHHTSMMDMMSENRYQRFMDAVVYFLGSRYEVCSNNRETGIGRADHLLIPRNEQNPTAWIIEYKYVGNQEKDKSKQEKAMLEALDQIVRQRYVEAIKPAKHIEQVIRIGIAFWKKVPLFGVQKLKVTPEGNLDAIASPITRYSISEDTGEITSQLLQVNPVTETRRKREQAENEASLSSGFFSKSAASSPKRAKRGEKKTHVELSSMLTRLRSRTKPQGE